MGKGKVEKKKMDLTSEKNMKPAKIGMPKRRQKELFVKGKTFREQLEESHDFSAFLGNHYSAMMDEQWGIEKNIIEQFGDKIVDEGAAELMNKLNRKRDEADNAATDYQEAIVELNEYLSGNYDD